MKKLVYPNVLIISHNVLSKTSNMGKTMTQFLGEWDKANLAQIYFHSEIPNVELCERYCRITDFDILKSLFTFKVKETYLTKNDIDLERKNTRIDNGIKSEIYRLGKNKKTYMHMLRNVLWSGKRWKTDKMMKWIDEFNPDVIFYPVGDYCFSIDVVMDICNEKNIPLVTFFGDEYYYLKTNNKSLFDKINKKLYRNSMDTLMKYTSFYITASDKMYELYKKKFGGNGCALLTPALKINKVFNNGRSKISYIGNLGLNRWKPLLEIGRILEKQGFILDIYSAETDKNILKNFTMDNGIRFNGVVSAEEVLQIVSSSIISIHAESNDASTIEKTRYSMSTKIAELLNSGVCIFAYGPEDIASMEYLKNNDAACVVNYKKDLEKNLLKILNSEQLRNKYVGNAFKLAEKRHNYDVNTNKFYEMINEAAKNRKEGYIYENSSS